MRTVTQKLRRTDSNKNYTVVNFIKGSQRAARASVPLTLLRQTSPQESPHLHNREMQPIRTDDMRYPGEYSYEVHTAVNSQSNGYQVYLYFKDLSDLRRERDASDDSDSDNDWYVVWPSSPSQPPRLTKRPFMKVTFHDRGIKTPLPWEVQDALALIPNAKEQITADTIDMLRQMANKRHFENKTPAQIARMITRSLEVQRLTRDILGQPMP